MPFKNPHPLYGVWQGMLRRCYTPSTTGFANYGGRGIGVCEEWRKSFHQFLADMGPRPDGYSLDRIDNDGNYEPGNCRWATRTEQQHNQRGTRVILVGGVKYVASELAKKSGLKAETIIQRAKTARTLDEVIDKRRRVFSAGLALGGQASGLKRRAKTHCKNGHEFTQENVHLTKEGWRACKACAAIREADRRRQISKHSSIPLDASRR